MEGPAIVRARRVGPPRGTRVQCAVRDRTNPAANVDRKPAIVTAKRRPGRFGEVPDMTLEEHRRRGEAADTLFREMVRRAAGKD